LEKDPPYSRGFFFCNKGGENNVETGMERTHWDLKKTRKHGGPILDGQLRGFPGLTVRRKGGVVTYSVFGETNNADTLYDAMTICENKAMEL
jgi:hypothetical protein